jgi:hypothetical protein
MEYSSFHRSRCAEGLCEMLWRARIETSNNKAVFKDALLATALR